MNSGIAYSTIDAPNKTALGRMLVEQPSTRIGYKFDNIGVLSTAVDKYDFSVSGNVAINPNVSSVDISATGAQTSLLMCKRRAYYIPSKTVELVWTSNIFSAPNTNSTTRIGLFDENDGLFVGYDSQGVFVCRRTSTTGSPVDNKTYQANWFNKLDLVDFTKTQLFIVRYLWFGFYFVSYSIILDGKVVEFYREEFNNHSIIPYMQTGSNNFRAEVVTTSGNQSLRVTCFNINSYGAYDRVATQSILYNNISTPIGLNTVELPIIAIRCRTRRATVRINYIDITNLATNTPAEIAARILNADDGFTITGGTWVAYGQSSVAEYNATLTSYSALTQKTIWQDIVLSRSSTQLTASNNEISFGLNASDALILTGRTGSGSANIHYHIQFDELI